MTQIEELRVEYGKIEKMDPSGPLYENLINALELLETQKLEMLANAQIKWVSILARNRVIRRGMGIK